MFGRKHTLAGLFFFVISPLLLWESGQAEVVKRISVGGIYDNNAYGSYAEEADYITQVDVYLGSRRQDERSLVEYYYAGNGTIFAQSGTRTFAINGLGIVYARLGEEGSGLFARGNLSLRMNRSYYDIYDYAGAQGTINGKWYIHPSLLLRLGYRLRWREYWNLDPYSYTEHHLFTQVNKFLPTRTTLRGDISYGYKDHPDPGREALGYGPFERRWRRMPSAMVEPGVPDEGQLVLALQVAQSLAEDTGLSLRYQTRLNTSSEDYDFLYGEGLGYSDDEDVFNDPYDYEGQEWTGRLTQLFPWGLRAVLGGGYENRRYDGRPALDVSGEPIPSGALRKDRNLFTSISVEKPLTPQVDAKIWYGYERNRSNDLYYHYDGRQSFSIDFKIGF